LCRGYDFLDYDSTSLDVDDDGNEMNWYDLNFNPPLKLNSDEIVYFLPPETYRKRMILVKSSSQKRSTTAPAVMTNKSKQVISYVCSYCPYKSDDQAVLKEHRYEYHVRREHFQCPTCQLVLKKELYFHNHMGWHAAVAKKTKHFCRECYQIFKSVEDLREHTHSNIINDEKKAEPTFDCPQCSRQYLSRSGLSKHIKAKHTIKTLCSKCGFIYDQTTDHKCAAEGESDTDTCPEPEFEPLDCEFCKETFYSYETLRKHISFKHHGQSKNLLLSAETLFLCTDCGWTFKSHQALTEHKPACPKVKSCDVTYDNKRKGEDETRRDVCEEKRCRSEDTKKENDE